MTLRLGGRALSAVEEPPRTRVVSGRNQGAAPAAAATIEPNTDIVFTTFATDGVDGPSDATGVIVDVAAVERERSRGLDAQHHLDRNDSRLFLSTVGDLLCTGLTGMQPGNVRVVLRT